MAVTDAELDDIQRDAESTARLVGAPGSPVRLRAEATVRLVAEVRRLRSLCRDGAVELERRGYMTAGELCARDALAYRLRAAGGDS